MARRETVGLPTLHKSLQGDCRVVNLTEWSDERLQGCQPYTIAYRETARLHILENGLKIDYRAAKLTQ